MKRSVEMKSSIYKSYDKLPLLLHSDIVSKALGFAPSSDYGLMHEKKFPIRQGPMKHRFGVLLMQIISV